MKTLRPRYLLLLTALLTITASLLCPTDAEARKKKKPAAQEEAASEKDDATWNVSEPPGDWQSITIDTEETTWSNLDVSPDGTTILFDMLGDLYTVPIEGGEATALTDGIEWNIQPRYSPDGDRIAFISDRGGADNLWLIDADGSAPQAVTEESEHLVHNPSWSADGAYIVAKKSFTSTRSIGAGEIWMFHPGGGDGLQLTDRPFAERDQKNQAEPAFSPDGRYVYFSRDTTPGRVWQYGKDPTGGIFSIERLDRETGETEVIVRGPGGAVRPTPSPDGKQLAFVKRLPGLTSALYLKDLESGKEWAIYERFERDHQATNGSQGNAPAIAWTPDSGSIVFWSGGKIRRVDAMSRQATVIPIHVVAHKKIQAALRFPVEVAPPTFRVRMPRWVRMSPDGSKVVFQALGHLYLKDLASGKQRRITQQNDHFEFYPSFSADGSQIVYVTWDDEKLGSVQAVGIDGGEGKMLTQQPGHYVEPKLSPDGKLLVYRKISGGFLTSPLWSNEPGLYVQAADGDASSVRRVSKSGSNPQFSAAGDRVLFTDDGEGTGQVLKSVNLDGFEERTHLKGAKVTEITVSPDGHWVAFTEQFNAYVAPFTLTGRTVTLGPKMTSIPVRQVSARSGEWLHFSATNDKLYWSHGATLYTRDLKDAFAFLEGAPEELPEPLTEGLDVSFEVAADRPEGMIALTGARVVTMRNANDMQEVIDNAVVLVDGNRIVAIGPASEIEVPADAFVVDVTGKTILPGLVDVHAHGPQARSELTPEQNWSHYAKLAFGVTTVHDPSNDSSSIFSAAEMQRAGRIVAPRTFSTGTILYGSHAPGATAKIDNLEDARFHVRRLKELGAISVKSYQQPRRDQRQQILAAGRELGIMVVPEGGMKYQHNMNEIVDGHTGIEHSLSIKTGYDDVRQLWSQTEVGYTPTFVVAFGGLEGERYWYEHTNVWENERLMRFTPRFLVESRAMRRQKAPESHYNHIHVARFAKQLRDLGVTVHIGAHGQRHGIDAHWEMWMMEQGGFTPWEALRGGTIDGAHYVGLDGDVGSIEVGKLADLIVIDGNPLEDLRRSEFIVYTMLDGRLYDAATMNQLAPDAAQRQEFFFEQEGGDTLPPSTETWMRRFQEQHHWVH
jgi:Tol biopolymer transport system component/imidazolonepropionase-like amidohydrolase